MLKILNIVGARPNFMKIAPIVREMKRRETDFAPYAAKLRTTHKPKRNLMKLFDERSW